MIEGANGVFPISSNAHNHPGEVGTALAASITAKVKARAVADIFRPVSIGRLPLPVLTEARVDSESSQPTLPATEARRPHGLTV